MPQQREVAVAAASPLPTPQAVWPHPAALVALAAPRCSVLFCLKAPCCFGEAGDTKAFGSSSFRRWRLEECVM
jgi:hypothetical protein